MSDPSSERNPLEALAEEFVERHRRGERPSLTEYADKHPDLADDIRELFPALVKMEHLRPQRGDTPDLDFSEGPSAILKLERLGDYRILREIGRGGMGIVYEAEQEALGRRVALKVLLGPAAQDVKLLARFRRESRTAAQLHHTNIVPVFDVGQQGNLCYYAMQYIRGQALDEVFRELQRLRAESTRGSAKEAAAPAGALAQSLWTGKYELAAASGTVNHEHRPTIAVEPVGPADTMAAALPDHSELSSVASNYQRYCRNVARLGLQVAQALAYAHAHGIIHRDIKPANLLLDTSGVLWVSDFGLVKTQDPALTDTGDLVGTLRYMAPERFRGECDALADVYALGLTLYELLVLRPAFDGKDRLHLVEQIGRQEPARLRALDPRIPRDLETILMKAIEKDPMRRYPSADDLAEDLRRYLADEPIKARRIGPLERLGRWGRRNPLVAGLSAAVVLTATLGFAGVLGQMQVAKANELKAQEHAAQAEQKEQEAKNERDQVRVLNDKLQRTLYASDMNLAQHAWEAGGAARVRDLLERHIPKAGETDLRGFEWYYLDRLCHAEILTLEIGAPFHVAFSPDGKRLVSTGHGGTKVWDAQSGQELLSLKGAVHNAVFSPDGKRLASSSTVWDAQSGKQLLTLEGGGVNVAYSPDGKRLASIGEERLKVWDAQTGRELLTLKVQSINCWPDSRVAFSPDGKRLASASIIWDNIKQAYVPGKVKVWDAQTGQELLSVKGHTGDVHSVAFSPDGKRLVGADDDKTVKVWDAHNGQELLTFKGHSQQVYCVAFSPDGKRLASASADKTVKVWDAQTGQELFTFKGHKIQVNSVAYSPDGKRLASAGWEGTVKVWDAQPDQKPLTLQGAAMSSVASVAFSPDGKRLASGGSGQPVSGPGALNVWNAQTGREILALRGHTAKVTTVAYSPDGKRVASGSEDKTLKVWDAQTGQELLTLKGHTGEVKSVVYSPDGKRLASGSYDNTVKVWDAHAGQELLTLKGFNGEVNSVTYSPDGKRLAAGGGQVAGGPGSPVTVKVWDAQTGKELLALKAPFQGTSVAFSPDGKRLATTGGFLDPGPVRVWDVQTGQVFLSLKGHTEAATSVAFSPDGKRLASAAADKTVKVWDAQTGEELLTLKGGGYQVIFSPDGQRLASDGTDGTVKVYDATPLPEKP